MPSTIQFIENEKDSIQLAAQLASDIKQNDIISFSGDLGSGKTFLCREIIKNLCGQKTQVISPTFNLLQTYDYKNYLIYHFDLYRLKYPDEIYELGIEDAFAGHICLIEWPELIENLLPQDITRINIEIISNTQRKITLQKTLAL